MRLNKTEMDRRARRNNPKSTAKKLQEHRRQHQNSQNRAIIVGIRTRRPYRGPFCNRSIHTAVDAFRHDPASALKKYGSFQNWDVSEVTNMTNLFQSCDKLFKPINASWNQISDWDTSSVTTMYHMFDNCYSFNQPLRWNTAVVRDLNYMFYGCSSFNQPLEWDTRSVERMNSMFEGCTSFDQSLLNWVINPIPSMFIDIGFFRPEIAGMFTKCVQFRGPVFQMTVEQYNDSDLADTPLGMEMAEPITMLNKKKKRALSLRNGQGQLTLQEREKIEIREISAASRLASQILHGVADLSYLSL